MDRTVLRILERILAADDLADACSVLLDWAAAERGFARAVVALGIGADIRGAGRGVSRGLLNEFLRLAGEPDTVAAAALSLTEPARLPDSAFPSGLEPCIVLPFRGPGAVRGAVLVEGAELDARLAAAAELVRRCGAGLGHRYLLERALRHADRVERHRAQLARVVEALPDPVLVTDADQRILFSNQRAEQLLSAAPDDSQGRRRAVHSNNLLFSSFRTQAVIGSRESVGRELTLIDPVDGSELLFEVISAPLPGETRADDGVISILRDVTDLRRALGELETEFRRSRAAAVENERLARELQRLNAELEDRIRRATVELEERNRRLEWQSRELEKASRLKTEFVAGMSHELRTPINVVIGYTSIMSERIYGELTPRQAEALGKIQTASSHLLDLINDILDLSRIEAGRMPVRVEDVRLDEVVYEVSIATESLLRADVDYRCDIPADLPLMRTDRTKLRQILLNLVSNAVKFTHAGSVTVSAEWLAASERIRISIVDTGIGIPEEHLEAIFDDFRQVDQTPTREYGGTGLGLAITRRLLRLLGGSISVRSEHGRGSRFTIELPVELEDPAETAPGRERGLALEPAHARPR